MGIRIAYFIDRILRGGTELQLIEQINRFSGKGIEQDLFCFYKSSSHDCIDIKCRVHIMNVSSLISINTGKKLLKIMNYLKRNNIGIVQTYFFDSTIFGVLAARLAGVKNVISCRRDMGFWYTPKLLRVLRFFNRFTDHILVNSRAVAGNVIRLENVEDAKLCVIRNGIDVEFFNRNSEYREASRCILNLNDDDVAVGIIANMDRDVKRIDLFVEAAIQLASGNVKLHFFAMGNGHLKNELIDLVKKEKREKQIHFVDNRSVSKLVLLSALDIGVICSDSEGLSNSILEYMATGIPVVATNVGGNPELITDKVNGLLVSPGNAKELTSAICSIVEDKKFRLHLGNQAKEDVKKYDWEKVIEEMTIYYNQLES